MNVFYVKCSIKKLQSKCQRFFANPVINGFSAIFIAVKNNNMLLILFQEEIDSIYAAQFSHDL